VKTANKNPLPLDSGAFPKTCNNCKRVYLTDIDFLLQTTPTPCLPSDVKVVMGAAEDDSQIFLEVFRNCACGSTLMDYFHCRRDLSENGIRKRDIFETILKALENSGHNRVAGRAMIFEFIELFSGG